MAGAVYVYEKDAVGEWNYSPTLRVSDIDSGDKYSKIVSLSSSTALVGAYEKYADGEDEAGASYIFRRDATGDWNGVIRLTVSNSYEYDHFGAAVALDGAYAVIGAENEDGGPGHPYPGADVL